MQGTSERVVYPDSGWDVILIQRFNQEPKIPPGQWPFSIFKCSRVLGERQNAETSCMISQVERVRKAMSARMNFRNSSQIVYLGASAMRP
jgi:hypothetical protein